MSRSRQETGKQGEDRAVELLLQQGYQIVERNFRCRFGEIDIVARDREIVCFVEVKARITTRFGLPEEAVDYRKQSKLRKLANFYMMQKIRREVNMRFDVIAIQYETDGSISSIRLIKGAF